MNSESLLLIVVYLFPISEVSLLVFKRAKNISFVSEDRGSLGVLWLVIAASISISIVLQWYPTTVLPLSGIVRSDIALVLLVIGLLIRWISILSLGRLFTVDVAINRNHHQLFQRGLYKYIRHPSYTGLLIEFLGLAVFFGNWVSIIIIMVPITGAVFYRIHCEEAVLIKVFGKQYEEYAAHIKRLLLGIV